MIAYLEGTILSKERQTLILGVHGVGYQVFVTPATLLAADVGSAIALHTHQYVREDALELYGFERPDERAMFRMLIAVSGVGPKSAIGILSITSPDQLRAAVVGGDVRLLTKVSGIGKKTAERLLVELKDTFTAEVKEHGLGSNLASGDVEVIEALERLGYSAVEARRSLESLAEDEAKDPEHRLKAALRQLGRR